MAIPNYNLVINRGFTCSRNFSYVEDDGTTPVPFDMTDVLIVTIHIGSSYTLTLKSDDALNAQGSKLEVTDRAGGTFRLYISDEQTALMVLTDKNVVGTYFCAIQKVDNVSGSGSSRIDPMFNGGVTVVSVG